MIKTSKAGEKVFEKLRKQLQAQRMDEMRIGELSGTSCVILRSPSIFVPLRINFLASDLGRYVPFKVDVAANYPRSP